jgi:DNA-binding NtrC family response regulator
MAGTIQDDWFLIERVKHGSPAATAGLRVGDQIAAIDHRPVRAWHELYLTRLSEYLLQRLSWEGRTIDVSVLREDQRETLEMAIRPLTLTELLTYFGARLALIIILVSLTVFMLISNPKDSTALFIAICFSALIFWFGSDRPGWPKFFSPLVAGYAPKEFLIRDLTVTFGMQIVLSALIHIVLVFPRSLLSPHVLNRILPIVYVVPSGLMAFFLLHYAEGNSIDHMTSVYTARLWLDTSLLFVSVVVLILNSRGRLTGIQREQSRWLTRAIVAFTIIHIGLWNLPKILTGNPLVPNYDWMLFSLTLIPAALTVSIANHRTFGIRGLIRRRLLLLSTMARREKAAVGRRDYVIRDLTQEIDQLREELRQYTAAEESAEAEPATTNRLQKLEGDYPEIREARKSSLLGRSPLWGRVFENAVLASRGDIPVLIVGESGTGKTHLARTVSNLSGRPREVYREISCSQFEHADPAFALGKIFGMGPGHGLPNAPRNGQPGLLEDCDGGTLFLDDFDRLPLNVQDLLLYPLEGKPFEPGVGSGPPRKVSVKFILATNQDPEELVKRGALRSDVLARMGARVYIPPLRERPEDIPLLLDHLIGLVGNEFNHRIDSVSPKAMNLIRTNEYRKGNVRELYAELRTAIGKASLEKDPVLRAGYLSDSLREGRGGTDLVGDDKRPERTHDKELAQEAKTETEAGGADISVELAALRQHAFEIRASEKALGLSHKSKTLSNYLRGMCIQALVENDWDLERAAHSLVAGDDRRVIARVQRKMQRYDRSIRERIAGGTAERLFNNLPHAYHNALSEAIRRITGG